MRQKSGYPEAANCIQVTDWRKSSRCASNECVEVAPGMHVRDSGNPDGTTLVFSPGTWEEFITGIKRAG